MKSRHIGEALLGTALAISFIASGADQVCAVQLRPVAGFPHPVFVKPSPAEIRYALQHASGRAKRDDAQYTVIDDPDEGYAVGQGTVAFGVNSSGAVVGYYDNGNTYPFERDSDGSYRTIDVRKTGSYAIDVNDGGAVAGEVGFYSDFSKGCPGFLMGPKGKVKKFEPPEGESGCHKDVYALDNSMSIVGDYLATDGLLHGYLREKNGAIVVFDPHDSVSTFATDINDNGSITGVYSDGNGYHGYIRDSGGAYTVFDAPYGPGDGDIAARINILDEVQGDFVDDNGVSHGLIREPDGTITVYDAPDAGQSAGQGTVGFGHINAYGAVAGYYWDSDNILHGYVRSHDGTLTEFDPPGSIWTIATDINDSGVVTGTYMDQYGNFHGFLRTPVTRKAR